MTDITDIQRREVRNTARIILDKTYDHSAQACELASFILATVDAPAPTLAEELRSWAEDASYDEDRDNLLHAASRAEQIEQERDHFFREVENVRNWKEGLLNERDEARAEAKTWREQDENDCEAYMEELASVREALTVEGRRVEKIAHDLAEARARVERLTAERDAMSAMVDSLNDDLAELRGPQPMPVHPSDQQSNSLEKPNSSLPDPADVKPGEAWLVECHGEIRPAVKDAEDIWCWCTVNNDGNFRSESNLKITLVSRLVPAPRVITNAEELDKLAEGTIVRDKDGDAWRRTCDEWTTTADYGRFTSWAASRSGPVTVLWEPEA